MPSSHLRSLSLCFLQIVMAFFGSIAGVVVLKRMFSSKKPAAHAPAAEAEGASPYLRTHTRLLLG